MSFCLHYRLLLAVDRFRYFRVIDPPRFRVDVKIFSKRWLNRFFPALKAPKFENEIFILARPDPRRTRLHSSRTVMASERQDTSSRLGMRQQRKPIPLLLSPRPTTMVMDDKHRPMTLPRPITNKLEPATCKPPRAT